MQKKLTLRLNDRVIREAKKIAEEKDTSVSKIVENYFRALENIRKTEEKRTSPILRKLSGILSEGAESGFHEHLDQKYR